MEIHLTQYWQQYLDKLIDQGYYCNPNKILEEAFLLHSLFIDKKSPIREILKNNREKESLCFKALHSSRAPIEYDPQWSKISLEEIQQAYHKIIQNYGKMGELEKKEYGLKKLYYSKTWVYYIGSLTPEGGQSIALTFIWFAENYLGIGEKGQSPDMQKPLMLVKKIVAHFTGDTPVVKQDKLHIFHTIQPIKNNIDVWIEKYNKNKLYPDRIKKEKQTITVLSHICAKQNGSLKQQFYTKESTSYKIEVYLYDLESYLRVDSSTLMRHFHKLNAVNLILRIDSLTPVRMCFYLHKDICNYSPEINRNGLFVNSF